MVRVCFVCLGNICRSPTAEAAMRKLLKAEGLLAEIEVDSAGTGDWHVGESPDRRALAAGKRRGLELRGRARRFQARDFDAFHYVVAMDQANLHALQRLAEHERHTGKIDLLRNFDPGSPPDADVPDPYYGGAEGFETVIDICESACRGLLDSIRAEHRL